MRAHQNRTVRFLAIARLSPVKNERFHARSDFITNAQET
jgi:hypothetical protein